MRNIALIGKARSGKDTAAAHLVRTRAYTRLAFADPLKEMALAVNPFVYEDMWRLSKVVSAHGWEYAKDVYPEVRRLLQAMGQAQREVDPDYWVNRMRPLLNNAEAWNMPVVVTDVRYRNEADMLRARGFRLVRVLRTTYTGREIRDDYRTDVHPSEIELDDFAADGEIYNAGSLADLYAAIESAL
ncbi:deoxynucleotide monophosphate kinase family protein [Streptomyces sp. NPDC003832]